MSVLASIRKKCLDCCCNNPNEVRLCMAEDCSLYPLRFGKRVPGVSPLKAIRARCLDCSADNARRSARCRITHCQLYRFRMGKNPNLVGKRRGNPDALAAFRNAPISSASRHQLAIGRRGGVNPTSGMGAGVEAEKTPVKQGFLRMP